MEAVPGNVMILNAFLRLYAAELAWISDRPKNSAAKPRIQRSQK
jgi:hypothetical protein